MKRLILVTTLFAWPALSPAATKHSTAKATVHAASAPAIYYDFKGARLGMSVADWRALPVQGKSLDSLIPDSPVHAGTVKAVCSGDPGTDASMLGFRTNAEEKANVVVCGYEYPESIGASTMWMRAWAPIGELQAEDVEYKFLDGTLYEISITGASGLLGEVMSGLTAKWGDPTTVVNDTTQNKAGATFPHTVKTWVNPVAMIRVETPYTKIDDLNVSYDTAQGLAKINAIEKSLNPDITKM